MRVVSGHAFSQIVSGHVIVCGLNELGFRIAEQLHTAGVAVVVIERRDVGPLRRRLERWGIPVLADSAHTGDALRQASIAGAMALIACHDIDLDNLETALVATEIAPELRLVVRVTNAPLGDQLGAALPSVRVLNLAEKAGHSFVEACIRSDVRHAFRLGSEIFTVVDVPVRTAGAFRQVFGNLTPVALRRPGARQVEVCPSRDTGVTPGDHIALLGRLADFADNGVRVSSVHDVNALANLSAHRTDPPSGRAGRRRRPHAWIRDLAVTTAAEFDRPFRLALGAVLTIMTIGTLVLSLTYANNDPAAPADFGPLDAFYLTVTTMATVGYGDFSFGAAASWLQAFGIALILLGALSIAIVYAFITNVIISRRLERTIGHGRATTVRDHVIVCGLGSVGLATVEGLVAAGRDVVIVERDANNRFLSVVRDLKVPVVFGDATVRATLMEAGLARATTLAALTSDDVANLEAVLSAREAFNDHHADRRRAGRRPHRPGRGRGRRRHRSGIDPARTRAPGSDGNGNGDGEPGLRVVLRIFDTTLADEAERRFAIHTARSASALATPWFVGAALDYEVVSTFYVDREPFLVARITVVAGGGLDGPTLQELSTGTRLLAIATSSEHDGTPDRAPNYRPTRHTRLRPGDEVLVVGPTAQIIDTVSRNQAPRVRS
ncbi:NAD-binding protein [Frankia sp. Cas3]|uniref:NAD-binding protein n=1 Tax=Frankia sp. Cas3 TaxID=3073926 RepID=UPI002AD3C6C8|nr:NAD-binding protein [Frankia sp. Cas3]